MKRIVTSALLAASLLVPSLARAAGVAYYYADKAASDCAEGKANAAAQQKDLDAKNAKVRDAEAKKAKDVDQLAARLQNEFMRRQQADAKKLVERIVRVAKIERKARHLDALVAVGDASDIAAQDLTASMIKRLDAGEGQPPVADADALRRERARADAAEARVKELEAAAKPAGSRPAVKPPAASAPRKD